MSTDASQNGPSRRVAALDVGTNSIRLIVAEVRPDGTYRLVDDEKENTRLGQGMATSGELSVGAMKASAAAIARMRDIANGYGVQELRAVGTSAVREAGNQKAFLDLVRSAAGIKLDVISAEEEARLAFLSVSHAFDMRALAAAVVDIGGGSTECVLSSRGVVEQVFTLPLGAVRLTEQFEPPDEDGDSDDERGFDGMCKSIRKTIKQHVGKPAFRPQLLIGTGGTFTAMAAIAMHRGQSEGEAEASMGSVRGYEIQRSLVNHLLNWLGSMSPKARARVPGLSPERAEIIVAGIAIVDGMMQRLKVNTLRVHDRGIRDGLILGMIRTLYPAANKAAAAPKDRMASVRQFAASCNYEKAHSDHVATLAVQAFDQLAAQMTGKSASGDWKQPIGRELLEAASVLHDVGYFINYAKHHKHSYHLIIHSDLPGYTHRELEIVANVARYHRRAEPKKSHNNFAKLARADRELVSKLAAILRVVDGLDRAHAQIIRSVKVRVRKGIAWFIVAAESEPTVDIWGADRKGRLFRKMFGLEVRFKWTGANRVMARRKLRRRIRRPVRARH